ncbi:hypothetical protein FOZ76_15835 [Verticiella sediminum]|uniref:Uncharacterized protein n=1 Tax=Verticiella sediminum TaxID=1247510 RepID=A0A556AIY3_9BURK|nr:hypothetical protein [Verticiella sediminum]TSH92864.1 hypothetical protein FOZ76_15835 [Verticiella sediminum]
MTTCRRPPLRHRTLLAFATGLAVALATAAHADPRSLGHGVSTARADDGARLVFFSAGEPPGSDGGWSHDVFVARWDPATGEQAAPQRFISRDEAQEPVAVAQARDGNILVTFEDGHDARGSVTQRYGVYDAGLKPVLAYPNEVHPGGHSGHAAAVGERFVVFYSDEWVHGGGVDDLGSGYGVYAKVYDTRGREQHAVAVAHERREWWPTIAGGDTRAMLLWQQYVEGSQRARLNVAPLDPVSGELGTVRHVMSDVVYYVYNIAWMPQIRRFLMVATSGEHGAARLLDENGEVTASLDGLPATVREAGIAVAPTGDVAYTPAADGRLIQIRATPDSLQFAGTVRTADGRDVAWRPNGSTGLFTDDGLLDWFTLEDGELVKYRFDPAANETTGR